MISGPLLLILIPATAAAVTFLLRQFPTISALLSAIILLTTGVWALQTPLNDPQTILGRTVVLSSGDRIGIAYLFVATAIIFIMAWRSSPSWTHYSTVLLILAALSAALIIRPPLNEIYPSIIYSALFITIASALAVFPLQGGKPGVTDGVLRFLTLMTLALPILLLSDYTLGQFAQSPDSADLAQATIILMGLGFTLLLAVAPFHAWVPTVSREAPPLSTAFVLSILQGAIWILLLDVLNENILISSNANTFYLLKTAGLLMAALGGILTWIQRDFGRILGYGALADMGMILYGVGINTSTGLAAASIVVTVRPLSIALMAMGSTVVREHNVDDSFTSLHGVARRLPWASMAMIAGGLSLAGLPPFAGFVGRWGIVQQVGNVDPRAALVMLGGSLSVAIAVLRGLREMLVHVPEEKVVILQEDDAEDTVETEETDARPQNESRSQKILILAGLALCILIGLFPGLIAPFIREFVSAYTFMGQ